jgi:drug/metabolite transporter (DMT)-like permease
MPVAWVVLLSQAAGLCAVVVLLAVRGVGPPPVDKLWPGLLAGFLGLVGLGAFYRALAVGTMSIVAPIAGAGMVLPALVGIAQGDHPGPVRLLGMLVTIAGVVIASREAEDPTAPPRHHAARTAVPLALLAALGFGTFALGLRSSARADVDWALFAARLACLAPLAVLLPFAGRSSRGGRIRLPERPRVTQLSPVVLVGLLDVSANGLYALATRHGLLSVVAVGSSLYPLITVLLARAVLGERIRRSQEAGVAAAVTGVVLIGAG